MCKNFTERNHEDAGSIKRMDGRTKNGKEKDRKNKGKRGRERERASKREKEAEVEKKGLSKRACTKTNEQTNEKVPVYGETMSDARGPPHMVYLRRAYHHDDGRPAVRSSMMNGG